jgi:hypothetical protein
VERTPGSSSNDSIRGMAIFSSSSRNARTDSTENYSLKAWLAQRFDRSHEQ